MITCPRCGTPNVAAARFCNSCGNALETRTAAEVRKTVTVLFMDAVGSTSMGEQTDPESLRRVMTRYFEEIRATVERHGGTIEKYIGDAVMAVFGVPTVHEDDALRAVRAALEIRARVAALSADLDRDGRFSVAWRTGVNTGEVVAGDAGAGQRFVTGDAVNVAARLEQAAAAGEILVGAETYRLVRDAVDAEPVEPVTAKGKAASVPAFRLMQLRGARAGGPRLDSPMVGRRRQRRLLAEAYEQVVDERVCHLFTVLGSAGVGKSRLVAEFLASLGSQAHVLYGRCLSYGEGITYWPIAEALREAASLDEADDDEAARRKIAALLDDAHDQSHAVERIGELLGRWSGGGTSEETFWAVRTLLESLARRRPVVLVLDDVHWAESTLLDLLEHLADWVREAPLLLLCLARQQLLELRPGWGGGKSYATTLTLEPLNENESRELMVNLLGQVEIKAELADRIAAAAEGNPLFVEEMVGMLIDTGVLERGERGWVAKANVAEVRVPPTIQALLAARLDGLPPAERTVIERGAVQGKVFHRGAVAELAPPEVRAEVLTHLRSLARKELVRPDRSEFTDDEAFRFRHLLIRDAAYSSMPKEARADLHARFAAWLAQVVGDHVAEYEEILGYHLEQAFRYRAELGAIDDDARRLAAEAAQRLAASGRRALERGDARAAAKLLGSAADLTPADGAGRPRLVADLGVALSVSGDLRRANALLGDAIAQTQATGDELGSAQLEVVRLSAQTATGEVTIEDVIRRCEQLTVIFERHGDRRGMAQAVIELARHHFFAGRAKKAEQLIVAQLETYDSDESPPPVIYGFLFAALFWGPTPVNRAIEAIEAVPTHGPGLEAGKARVLGGLKGLLGDLDAGRELLRRSLAIERELGRATLADATLGHFMGPLEMLAENYDEAERLLLEAYEQMTARGDTAFSSTVAAHLAHTYIAMKRLGEAERFAHITLATSDADDMEAKADGAAAFARVLAARGEFDAALAQARLAVEIADRTDYLDTRGSCSVALAEVLTAAGRSREAVAAMTRALENFDAKGALVFSARMRRRLAEMQSAADPA